MTTMELCNIQPVWLTWIVHLLSKANDGILLIKNLEENIGNIIKGLADCLAMNMHSVNEMSDF
jgi:hypothetical protein